MMDPKYSITGRNIKKQHTRILNSGYGRRHTAYIIITYLRRYRHYTFIIENKMGRKIV